MELDTDLFNSNPTAISIEYITDKFSDSRFETANEVYEFRFSPKMQLVEMINLENYTNPRENGAVSNEVSPEKD